MKKTTERQIHQCPQEAIRWAETITDFDNAFGALVNHINDDKPIVKYQNDPAWMLEVNGCEYRGPIRFCPLVREKLPI